jgi:hypothetical protein
MFMILAKTLRIHFLVRAQLVREKTIGEDVSTRKLDQNFPQVPKHKDTRFLVYSTSPELILEQELKIRKHFVLDHCNRYIHTKPFFWLAMTLETIDGRLSCYNYSRNSCI